MGDSTGDPGRHLRVVLVACSGVLGGIIRTTLAEQPDVQIVADLESLPADDSLVAADFLIWNNADEALVERWVRTLAQRCGPHVLATLGDGRDASVWELIPHRTAVVAPSPATLVETIRASFAEAGREPR